MSYFCHFATVVEFNLLENGFNEPEAIHLELDIKELRSQLQDEKRYSTELKKELNRLHGLIANQSQMPEVSFGFVRFTV